MGAWALSGALNSVLFEVQPDDPATYGGMALVLAVVAGVAAYLPANRATRGGPVRALRGE